MNHALLTSSILRVSRQIFIVCLVLFSPSVFAQSGATPRPFTIHDIDGDGYLSREEYRVLLELRRQRKQQRRLAPQPAPAFDGIDRDRDGRIGEQELTDMLHHKLYRYRCGGPPWCGEAARKNQATTSISSPIPEGFRFWDSIKFRQISTANP